MLSIFIFRIFCVIKVTEHKMAINVALMGGMGVIHNNMSIDEQVWKSVQQSCTDEIKLEFCWFCWGKSEFLGTRPVAQSLDPKELINLARPLPVLKKKAYAAARRVLVTMHFSITLQQAKRHLPGQAFWRSPFSNFTCRGARD